MMNDTNDKIFFYVLTIMVMLTMLALFSRCSPSRSALVADRCVPLPCKMTLEYIRQNNKGSLEMSGVLVEWCKRDYNREEYTRCMQSIK